MAAQTTYLMWDLIPEFLDPYYVKFVSLMNQVDSSTYYLYERVANIYQTIGTVGSPGALRSNHGVAGAVAFAKGFDEENDGSGGLFAWKEGSATDDGGITIVPIGTPTGFWYRIFDGPINARWFGLHPDATASDNVTALNKAIAAALDGNYGDLYIPAGTYQLNDTITIDAGLTGYIMMHGTGRETVLDFTTSTAQDCLFVKQVYRGIFANFKITGPAAKTTRGLRIGDEAGGTSSSDNIFYNLEIRTHDKGLYTEGGVTNGFIGCEFDVCTRAMDMTAQSNVYSFFRCYFLQNSHWLTITKSNVVFSGCTFQTILSPVENYAMIVNDTEISITDCYFEKKKDSIDLMLINSTETSDTLVASLRWKGGHVTPDGNSIVRYAGSPQIEISGMNNSIGPNDLTTGIQISRLAAVDFGLKRPVFAPTWSIDGFRPPELVAEFRYGNDATNSSVIDVAKGYVEVQGEPLGVAVTQNDYYTFVILAQCPTTDPAANRLYMDQRDAGGRIERRPIYGIPVSDEAWEVVYVPFRALGTLVELETLLTESMRIKLLQLYRWTYFPPIDPNFMELLKLDDSPQNVSTTSWKKGDIALNNSATRAGPAFWVCIASAAPGVWKPIGGNTPTITTSLSTYNVVATDWAVLTTRPATGPAIIRIPSSFIANAGAELLVKDASGNAGTQNISIETVGSETIDGAATATVNWNYGAMWLKSDGSNLWIIGKY